MEVYKNLIISFFLQYESLHSAHTWYHQDLKKIGKSFLTSSQKQKLNRIALYSSP